MKDKQPAFNVGRVPVYGRLILAPMAGYADVPHRAICQAHGSAMQYTEFVAAEMILAGDKYSWGLLARRKEERPFTIQLFSHDPHRLLAAAQKVESLAPDIIDINMGCSTRKVSGRGAGVGLMRRPERVAETFRLLTRHLTVPVTGKIRLGWEENRNYLEIARIMADNGAALVAIHPRTKEQKYGGEADWEAIAAVKQAVSIPVIGNGDVQSATDAARMMAETGCDGVMIGRAAVGAPWLFNGRDPAALSLTTRFQTMRRHLDEMVTFYGEAQGLTLFRKYLKRYLEPFPAVAPLLKQMVFCHERARLDDQLQQGYTELHGEKTELQGDKRRRLGGVV